MFTNLSKTHKIIIQAVLVVFAVCWLYPLVVAVVQSLKIHGFGNYAAVMHHPKVNYFRVVFNSLLVAFATMIIVGLFATLGAYAFSKMQFKLKNVLFYSLVACLAIPATAVMSPLFFTMKSIHLMNTYWSLILPLAAFNAPFMLLILKNYFDGIPNAILEAGMIDGSSSFRMYRQIMLPLGMPAIINIMVLTFIYSWNDYIIPLLFVRKEAMYTVTLATQYFTGTTSQTPEMVAQLYAALILMTIPSVAIYMFGQRFMQAGLTAGAVKS
ncbi:carbohydrate ABC transporter permease [Paenibacillus sp. R14(2021)]|uniref:carbohydrate ABC transporter permease n=1 Tax=Paenibacillus sp. R14(2021) TaxID=2859228 RepID=UPI001C611518|nr:carbohydrate ABC transporter permease [Paenibacillus sp. R14(2021)]